MSNPSLKSIAQALGVLLLPLTALLAADPSRVEKTFKTTSNPRISVSNLAGQVTIRGWSRTQIHTVYTIASPRVEVDTTVVPEAEPVEKIHFDTHVLDPLTTGKGQNTDYTMEVPFGSTLEVANRQGSVTIENLEGEASVESVGSSVLVRDIGGHLAVRSVGGDVEVLRPSGRVEASSITGNLHFVSASGSHLRGITTSGKILYEGDLASGGDYELSSYSGDIAVLCPASSSFELNAKTVRGKVDNALALTPRRHSPSPGNGLFGTHNTGNANVEVKSFSGTIRIRPQP